MRAKSQLSLNQGAENNRFVVMKPAGRSFYESVTSDLDVQPESIGGTWYPELYEDSAERATQSGSSKGEDLVVLHFHGGAYVMGDGRSTNCGFLAQLLLTHAGASHVFCPQYRLACNAGGQFPAALQDAVTSYVHLTDSMKIPPHTIVVSGDSAGGHLALNLLRYIEEHASPDLCAPKCAWLFSPWSDVSAALDPKNWLGSPNYPTDYIPAGFAAWGATAFLDKSGADQALYASPLRHPFKTKTPIFVHTGGAEVLHKDNIGLMDGMNSVSGNKVEIYVENAAPHDIMLIGNVLGFPNEATRGAQLAGAFAFKAVVSNDC